MTLTIGPYTQNLLLSLSVRYAKTESTEMCIYFDRLQAVVILNKNLQSKDAKLIILEILL